jgi:formate/nitrite transporter FocA (FNT family)
MPDRLVATASADRVSITIWSSGAAAGLYLGTGLILALLVHTHYPGALGLREWIRVVLSWPLIFFLRGK